MMVVNVMIKVLVVMNMIKMMMIRTRMQCADGKA